MLDLFLTPEKNGTAPVHSGSNGTSISDSENGYGEIVEDALADPKVFSTFKSSKAYTRILEHLKKDVGQKYLEIVKDMSPELMTRS